MIRIYQLLTFNITQKCGISFSNMLYYCLMKVEFGVLLSSIKIIMSYSEAQIACDNEVVEKSKKEWIELDQMLSKHYKNESQQ